MISELRKYNRITERELGRVNAPHFALRVLDESLQGFPYPQPRFSEHLHNFLIRHYDSSGERTAKSFDRLQADLQAGQVLLLNEWPHCPAFEKRSIKEEGQTKDQWVITEWVLAQHEMMMSLLLANVNRVV